MRRAPSLWPAAHPTTFRTGRRCSQAPTSTSAAPAQPTASTALRATRSAEGSVLSIGSAADFNLFLGVGAGSSNVAGVGQVQHLLRLRGRRHNTTGVATPSPARCLAFTTQPVTATPFSAAGGWLRQHHRKLDNSFCSQHLRRAGDGQTATPPLTTTPSPDIMPVGPTLPVPTTPSPAASLA